MRHIEPIIYSFQLEFVSFNKVLKRSSLLLMCLFEDVSSRRHSVAAAVLSPSPCREVALQLGNFVLCWRPNTSTHHRLNLLNGSWCLRHVVNAVCCHNHVVFNAHPSPSAKLIESVGVDKLAELRVVDCFVHFRVDEIAPRLDSQHHVLFDLSCGPKTLQPWLAAALRVTVEVTADVMRVEAEEVAQSVWHKQATEVRIHHLTHIPVQAAELNKRLQHLLRCKEMHVRPEDTRLECTFNCTHCVKNTLVNDLLLLCEHTIDWIRASDISTEAVVLSAHIKQRHPAVVDGLVVWSAGVSVVEYCRRGPASANARVRRVSAAAMKVNVVHERRLQLELRHPRSDVSHHLHMRLRRDLSNVSQDVELFLCLEDAQISNDRKQSLFVDSEAVDAVKGRGDGEVTAV
eukprot:m.44206 g.44206  ORF g.44206 m.44206 type:complete len:402 (+) comp10589_c0_seq1:80-1285(+)